MITSMCSRLSFWAVTTSNYMQFIVYETDFSEGSKNNESNGRCTSNRANLYYNEIDISSYNSVVHSPLYHWVNTDEKMSLIVCFSSFILFSSYSSSPSPRPISCHLPGSFTAISFMRSIIFGSQHRPVYSSGFEEIGHV